MGLSRQLPLDIAITVGVAETAFQSISMLTVFPVDLCHSDGVQLSAVTVCHTRRGFASPINRTTKTAPDGPAFRALSIELGTACVLS